MATISSNWELPTCCGVVEFGDFGTDSIFDISDERPTKDAHLGGAGLGVAAFINTAVCREAYEELKERFNIAYQTTPRLNVSSGNHLFFVVYDGEKK